MVGILVGTVTLIIRFEAINESNRVGNKDCSELTDLSKKTLFGEMGKKAFLTGLGNNKGMRFWDLF